MEWYYSNSGVQSGPVSIEDLRAKVTSGEVLGADLVWRDGMPDWMPASAVPELSGAGIAASAVVGANGGLGAPAYPMAPQTPGLAIASLICGLVGLLGAFACWLPGLVGIGGIVCGHMALKKIKKDEAQYIGKGLAIGGLVTGYLAILVLIASILFFVGIMVLGKTASDFSTTEMTTFEKKITTELAEPALEESTAPTPPVAPPAEPEQ